MGPSRLRAEAPALLLGVGIVGYGFAGRGFHAYLLTHEPRFSLAAVASRDPGRRARAEVSLRSAPPAGMPGT